MATEMDAVVHGYDSRRGEVAVKVGLSPKAVRIPTDESWEPGEKVIVSVRREGDATPAAPAEFVIIGGMGATDTV